MSSNKGAELNLTHIVRPAKETSGDGPVPGLLLLHGRGADEYDLMGLESALDSRLTIVSARAPYRLGPGYAWYGMAQTGSPDPDNIRASLQALNTFIEGMLGTYNIDPAALYVGGFSQGAIMSAAVALTAPAKVRGVIMHSGYVPVEAGLEIDLAGIAHKPFFVAHGMYDDVISVTFGRQSRQYLTAAGTDLTYREYPIGHSISEESLDDMSEWLSGELNKSNKKAEPGSSAIPPRIKD